MPYLLEMKNITKTFGSVKAIDNVSLRLNAGEIVSLCGENGSGKSTLMKVLCGIYPHGSYEGEIIFAGEEIQASHIRDTERKGIAIIHQELALVKELTVLENIFLGNEITHNGIMDYDLMTLRCQKLLAQVSLSISPDTRVGDLGLGQQQLVEIAKALNKQVRLLILDEPTASLTEQETSVLLDIIRDLQQHGIACIYISHKLNEVKAISDTICVIRDGQHIGTRDAAGMSEDDIITMMVGRELTALYPNEPHTDRQVVEGVGEYLQASQSEWDIFIEEDFRARIDKIKDWLGDGVIADFDDKQIEQALADVDVPIVGVGGSYHLAESYPPVHYIATDNYALVESAFLHLKEKGVNRFAFYGLPESSGKRWATEREYAFRQLVAEEKYRGVVYQGLETAPENWQHAQNRLADWLQTLPPQTGIIAVTDARARHILQVCEHLHIPVPEKLCVIGIDNEELTRYLSRVALSSVAQGARQMGYQAAKLLHRLLDKEEMPLQRILVPPVRVIERRSTDYRSLTDPAVIQAMHYIRNHACKGIKVDQVLDAVGISRSNLEKRFKEEVGETIHAMIHAEKLEKARSLLISTTLSINEISQMCGYPSLQYFYSVFKKAYDTTPKEYRDVNSEVML